MHGKTKRRFIAEDYECLQNWENYTMLDRLPHELGITTEAYREDIEAIKTMKRWMQEREEHEQKRLESKKRMRQRMRKGRS